MGAGVSHHVDWFLSTLVEDISTTSLRFFLVELVGFEGILNEAGAKRGAAPPCFLPRLLLGVAESPMMNETSHVGLVMVGGGQW